MPTMLVTGASRGIGAAIVEAAAAAGWDVAANYRSERERTEQLAVHVTAATARRIVPVPGDVSIEADVLAMFETTIAALGPIDCLVNNAGIAPGYGPFAGITVADMERIWAVNLTGAFLCAREAVRHMAHTRGGRGGSIVNISSKAGVIGGPNEWIHYAASKGGLDTMTAGLSKEVAADGIRVNSVRPGLIVGEFGPWAPEGRGERMWPAIPMQRAAEPAEIAAAVIWLASDHASYVTGAVLDVTGGR